MRVLRFLRWMAVSLACVDWIVPVHELAAAAPAEAVPASLVIPARPLVDVALDARGRLAGQIVDRTGKPLAQQAVEVHQVSGRQVLRATSDADGRFVVEGLSGGVFQVTAENVSAVCRCWTPAAAPPAANSRLLLVSNNVVERGQKPFGEALFSTPVLIGLIIAAAIAIPIVVHNAKDNDEAS